MFLVVWLETAFSVRSGPLAPRVGYVLSPGERSPDPGTSLAAVVSE